MSQLQALVVLRWSMVRLHRVRVGLTALSALFPLLLLAACLIGQALPPGERLFNVLLLAPTLFLVFAALAVIAPLVAGGGNELFPDGQLAAFPVHPRTVFQSGLLVAPLNLAWAMQVLVLVGVTGAVAFRGPRVVLAQVTTLAYIALVTVAGQALAWYVVAVRHSRRGRIATRAVAAVLGIGVLAVLIMGAQTALLDAAPTTRVVIAAIAGSQGHLGGWALVTGLLLTGTLLAHRVGARACALALRRTSPSGSSEHTPVVRREGRRHILAELVAVDRASVWRSIPLRRGALVLAVLPGSVAMLADASWASLTLLPGLVAAGAGLLFGVNTFCLDGSGALFVAGMPHPPRQTLVAKLVIVGETCLVAVLLAMALAVTRVDALPTGAELIAVLGSVFGTTLLVVSSCARLSVTRPHKADLRGPRDTPAPPATMAVYSLRLALATTPPGLLFGAAAVSGSVVVALCSTVAVLALAARSLIRTLALWSDPVQRARVVTTVSSG